jgi:ADP-heptose:LPS heptosyltransferase
LKTRTQIIIDQYMARPLAIVLNLVTRIVGKILRIDHNLDKSFKTIAICKFKGMGSIIQATPMIAAIKEQHPEAEIIFVSTCGNRKLLERIDLIDTVICLDDRSFLKLLRTFFSSLYKLIRKKPDVYIDLEIYSDFSSLFTLFTLSQNRIGYYLRSSTFRMGIYTHMMFFNPRVPISEVYLQMAWLIGYRGPKPPLYPIYKNIETSPEARYPSPYIVINPNASDLRIERRWPAKNFVALIQDLLKSYPQKKILLIGSGSERTYTQSIKDELPDERVINFAGKTTLDDLIQIIRNANVLITNDTGPMHLGFACKTPAVCLFGPCAPTQYGQYENAWIIYHNLYCSPCVHEFETPPCNGNNICMQKINVKEVLEMTAQALGEKSVSGAIIPEKVVYSWDEKIAGLLNRT